MFINIQWEIQVIQDLIQVIRTIYECAIVSKLLYVVPAWKSVARKQIRIQERVPTTN